MRFLPIQISTFGYSKPVSMAYTFKHTTSLWKLRYCQRGDERTLLSINRVQQLRWGLKSMDADVDCQEMAVDIFIGLR